MLKPKKPYTSKKKYNPITPERRQIIIYLFGTGSTPDQAATTLNINPEYAQSIHRQWRNALKKAERDPE